jgi:hypothetical protein
MPVSQAERLLAGLFLSLPPNGKKTTFEELPGKKMAGQAEISGVLTSSTT